MGYLPVFHEMIARDIKALERRGTFEKTTPSKVRLKGSLFHGG